VGTRWGNDDLEAGQTGFEPDDCWAIRGGRMHVYAPASGVPCRHVANRDFTASICVPISNNGETIGLMHLSTPASPSTTSDSFVGDEMRLATVLTEQVSLALGNLRLRDRLRNQAIRDPLTGLFNRRYLEETLGRELERCRRTNTVLSVLMLDVDHFKRFNDTQGHDAGDTLLSEMGSLLRQFFRGSDIPCRYGGEEFVVVMPDTPVGVAEKRANQLREAVKGLRVMHQGRHLGTVTISVGAAEYPMHGGSWESVMKVADIALYEAKQGGRDRVRLPPGTPVKLESRSGEAEVAEDTGNVTAFHKV
jgi:diguanylate cyclase (GGDEF)-like protein